MATVNFIPYRSQSATALGRVCEYVAQEKKSLSRQLVSGINCSPQFSVQEFKAARMVCLCSLLTLPGTAGSRALGSTAPWTRARAGKWI